MALLRGVLLHKLFFAKYFTVVDINFEVVMPPPPQCLHRSSGVGAHVIHPWIHQFSNCWSCDDQLTSVRVPDVDPCDLPKLGLFSMAAGDFLMVYTNPGIINSCARDLHRILYM